MLWSIQFGFYWSEILKTFAVLVWYTISPKIILSQISPICSATQFYFASRYGLFVALLASLHHIALLGRYILKLK